jgi:hypothetical protein
MKYLLNKLQPLTLHFFHGNKADPISFCWNDNDNEIDDNVVCSNTNINDDKQNKKRPDDNTIRMSESHKEPPVTGNDDFYGKRIIIWK